MGPFVADMMDGLRGLKSNFFLQLNLGDTFIEI